MMTSTAIGPCVGSSSANHEPCGAVEQFLVQRVALGIIRVKRAAELEADVLTEYLHPPSHKPSREDLQLRVLMKDSECELIDPESPRRSAAGSSRHYVTTTDAMKRQAKIGFIVLLPS